MTNAIGAFSGVYNMTQNCTVPGGVAVGANGQCPKEHTKIKNYCAQMGAPGHFTCIPGGKTNAYTNKKDRAYITY